MSVRKFARVKNRVESGAIQFGDDWPGLFLRGDDAAYLSMAIECVLQGMQATGMNKLAILHLQETKETIDKEVDLSRREQKKPV